MKMTYTTYTENFASIISPDEASFYTLLSDAAGDFVDDYDMDQAVSDYVDAINEVIRPLGVVTTVSGVSYCEFGADIDDDAVAAAASSVDGYDILQKNDISGK